MCYAIQEPVKTKTVELFVRYALWWTHFAGCIHNDIHNDMSLEQIDILNVRHKFIRCTFCAYISLCLNSDYSVLTNKRLVYMKCSSNSSLTVSNRIQRKKIIVTFYIFFRSTAYFESYRKNMGYIIKISLISLT